MNCKNAQIDRMLLEFLLIFEKSFWGMFSTQRKISEFIDHTQLWYSTHIPLKFSECKFSKKMNNIWHCKKTKHKMTDIFYFFFNPDSAGAQGFISSWLFCLEIFSFFSTIHRASFFLFTLSICKSYYFPQVLWKGLLIYLSL